MAAASVAQLLQLVHLSSHVAHHCILFATTQHCEGAMHQIHRGRNCESSHKECAKVNLGAQKILEATAALILNASLQCLGL